MEVERPYHAPGAEGAELEHFGSPKPQKDSRRRVEPATTDYNDEKLVRKAHETLLWLGYQVKLREPIEPPVVKRATLRETKHQTMQSLAWLGEIVARRKAEKMVARRRANRFLWDEDGGPSRKCATNLKFRECASKIYPSDCGFM
eukprot:GEMP01029247.1.p1 GENE.GEMP01029247.1~~GEMP01029247.1.p1  ORF type:complete len:145 (+),score=32.84 GEMP01029247.1:109-543(+)